MSNLTGDDWARLVYLSLLLLALLGFFSFRGGRRSLRDALIWVLIFLMVVLAYGFRDVIRGELFPARTAVIEGGAGVELRRGDDGHFHAAAEVNGVDLSFLVDTGASGIVLSREDATAAGINVDALSFTGEAMTANGMARLARTRLDSLRLGPIEARDVPASVSGGGLGVSLMGMDFLQRFARIEIEGDRMRLYP